MHTHWSAAAHKENGRGRKGGPRAGYFKTLESAGPPSPTHAVLWGQSLSWRPCTLAKIWTSGRGAAAEGLLTATNVQCSMAKKGQAFMQASGGRSSASQSFKATRVLRVRDSLVSSEPEAVVSP